jgi:hypothetical protein
MQFQKKAEEDLTKVELNDQKEMKPVASIVYRKNFFPITFLSLFSFFQSSLLIVTEKGEHKWGNLLHTADFSDR